MSALLATPPGPSSYLSGKFMGSTWDPDRAEGLKATATRILREETRRLVPWPPPPPPTTCVTSGKTTPRYCEERSCRSACVPSKSTCRTMSTLLLFQFRISSVFAASVKALGGNQLLLAVSGWTQTPAEPAFPFLTDRLPRRGRDSPDLHLSSQSVPPDLAPGKP